MLIRRTDGRVRSYQELKSGVSNGVAIGMDALSLSPRGRERMISSCQSCGDGTTLSVWTGSTCNKYRAENSTRTWELDIPDDGWELDEVGQGGGSDQTCHQEKLREWRRGGKQKTRSVMLTTPKHEQSCWGDGGVAKELITGKVYTDQNGPHRRNTIAVSVQFRFQGGGTVCGVHSPPPPTYR